MKTITTEIKLAIHQPPAGIHPESPEGEDAKALQLCIDSSAAPDVVQDEIFYCNGAKYRASKITDDLIYIIGPMIN